MTLTDYSHLKRQVIETVENKDSHNSLLESIKQIFKEDINSVRRFEQIRNIVHLLRVLELRANLSEDNVELLKIIANKIGSNDLVIKVTDYEKSYERRGSTSTNLYAKERACNSNTAEKPFTTGMSEKKDRIIKVIVQGIGTFWRDLARSLKIRECDIDDIDYRYNTLATKAMKMMELYETYPLNDPNNWYFSICQALEKIHRKDLSRSVNQIMKMNL